MARWNTYCSKFGKMALGGALAGLALHTAYTQPQWAKDAVDGAKGLGHWFATAWKGKEFWATVGATLFGTGLGYSGYKCYTGRGRSGGLQPAGAEA